MTNFGAAFDLSALSAKPVGGLTVAGWLVRADEATLRSYLKLSESAPVLMLISDASEESLRVRTLLAEILSKSEGRFAGLEVDLVANPELAQAVGINQAPAMLAILAGQPAPLFKGEATQEQILKVLQQVLELAKQNSLTARFSIGAPPKAEPELSPEHQSAYEAIERGDLEGAKLIYEKLTVEYPKDNDAIAGLAQVELMIRMQLEPGLDPLNQVLFAADQAFLAGDSAGSFGLLLDRFAEDFENREAIRDRLISLFVVVGDVHPEVLAARKRLSMLMF
ncbi:tetratricopeptide repeat protein [Candidatus Aquiluna sp. UB-MaderosW2red]|uniref:tetratricopeptide repeat protein n=1 Tax=Candidatus Aquiluna sp. UB-MaderosW2red TaxID=1855377 RepID=UPI000875E512|nr:tetratricopeptide repeat protein [Candidatus Aquiluna sp. UB-MaderosW2red]SCX09684.1 putative thioredoxin [Candidatus Aquiluna sp. UB-MaderosW2red]